MRLIHSHSNTRARLNALIQILSDYKRRPGLSRESAILQIRPLFVKTNYGDNNSNSVERNDKPSIAEKGTTVCVSMINHPLNLRYEGM